MAQYFTCSDCAHRWLGTPKCPRCGTFSKAESNDDMTKKTFGEPDLKKGLR